MIIVNDIVHGSIELPSYILAIIDTKEFQRLRWISQTGFAQFVYPTATGSRFEHSIGTFHLASQLIKQIKQQINKEDLKVELTDNEMKCVEIAALCHDIGHGPYSHTWEHVVVPLLGNDHKSHEELSCEILEDVLNRLKRSKEKDEFEITNEDIKLIQRIILGKHEKVGKNKKFLFEIVANKYSGLDVDKFDYLCRDIIYLGWSNKTKILDIRRLMQFYRLIKTKNDEWRLAIRDKEVFSIHDIFYSRHFLHRYACRHKTVLAVDCMFRDAMTEIVKNENFRKELISNVIEESAENGKHILHSKEFIVRCCDYHIWNIISKHTKDIVKSINERNLYKLYIRLKVEKRNAEVVEENKGFPINKLENVFNSSLQKDMVRITYSKFALSSDGGNQPIFRILFYRKDQMDKCFNFDEEIKPPEMTTLTCEESVIMIFTKFKLESKEEKSIVDDIIRKLSPKEFQQSDSSDLNDLLDIYSFSRNI